HASVRRITEIPRGIFTELVEALVGPKHLANVGNKLPGAEHGLRTFVGHGELPTTSLKAAWLSRAGRTFGFCRSMSWAAPRKSRSSALCSAPDAGGRTR